MSSIQERDMIDKQQCWPTYDELNQNWTEPNNFQTNQKSQNGSSVRPSVCPLVPHRMKRKYARATNKPKQMQTYDCQILQRLIKKFSQVNWNKRPKMPNWLRLKPQLPPGPCASSYTKEKTTDKQKKHWYCYKTTRTWQPNNVFPIVTILREKMFRVVSKHNELYHIYAH